MPAASAAAFPPLEPPAVLPGWTGFPTVPYHGFWLVTPHANSCRFALPISDAPAASRRSTDGAVCVGHMLGEDLRAVRRAHAGGVDQVLDQQSTPGERPRRPSGPDRPR